MENMKPWLNGFAVSILFFLFFIDLLLEVTFQILWADGFKEFGFWIENSWKFLLAVSIVVAPLLGRFYYLKGE